MDGDTDHDVIGTADGDDQEGASEEDVQVLREVRKKDHDPLEDLSDEEADDLADRLPRQREEDASDHE